MRETSPKTKLELPASSINESFARVFAAAYATRLDPTLEELAAKKSLTEVTVDTLVAAGFISSNDKVKILGNGTISKALAVKAHAFSKSAEAAITAAGGSVEKL